MDDQANDTPGAQSARIPVVLRMLATPESLTVARAHEAGVPSGGESGTEVTMSFALPADA